MRSASGILIVLLVFGSAGAQQPLPYYPQFEGIAPKQSASLVSPTFSRSSAAKTVDADLPSYPSLGEVGQLAARPVSFPEVPSDRIASRSVSQLPKNAGSPQVINRYTNPGAEGQVPYMMAQRPQAQPYVQSGSELVPLGSNPGWNPQGAQAGGALNSAPPHQIPSLPERVFANPGDDLVPTPDPYPHSRIPSDRPDDAPYPGLANSPGLDELDIQEDYAEPAEQPEQPERWKPFASESSESEAPSFMESPVAATTHHVSSFYGSAVDTSCGRCSSLTRIPKLFGGNLQGGAIAFSGTFTGTIASPAIGAGALNIADNGSPIPTDRVFFTYQRFSNGLNTSLLNGAVVEETEYDFDAYTMGLEKTFFNQRISVEARIPFVDSAMPQDFTINGTSVRAETGSLTNVSGVLKTVIWENDSVLLSTGVGMRFVPGSASTTVQIGNDVMTYEQAGVDFVPFVGFASSTFWDTFLQGMLQYNFPTDDDLLTTTSAGNSSSSAILRQQSLNFTIAAGKWLFDRPGCFFSGMSLIGEANYSTAFGTDETITLAPGAGITTTQILLPRYDTLSLSTGVTLEMLSCLSSRLAVGVPVLQDENRIYDTEVQYSLNWRF